MRAALILSFALWAGCFSPRYLNGMLRCSVDGEACPDGYHCAFDKTCWRNGEEPPGPTDGGADMPAPPLVYPPAAVWISSGGGSATGASGNQYGLSVGGVDVAGKTTSSSGPSATSGYFSSAAQ